MINKHLVNANSVFSIKLKFKNMKLWNTELKLNYVKKIYLSTVTYVFLRAHIFTIKKTGSIICTVKSRQ